MYASGIPRNKDDAKKQYPHIALEAAATLIDIEATPEQWKAADSKAKENIDILLEKYNYAHKPNEEIKVMVIGTTGSGKSATANTLIGHKWFREGSSTGSMTSEAYVTFVTSDTSAKILPVGNTNLVVCDTPGSWESQARCNLDGVDCYVIVINLAAPRFSQETLTKIRSLKGLDGSLIVQSGRFMVALSHADGVLQQLSLKEYLNEIHGDPLHTFLTQLTQGRVVAINNAAETEYQKGRHQEALFALLVQVYNHPEKGVKTYLQESLNKVKELGGSHIGTARKWLGLTSASLWRTSPASGTTTTRAETATTKTPRVTTSAATTITRAATTTKTIGVVATTTATTTRTTAAANSTSTEGVDIQRPLAEENAKSDKEGEEVGQVSAKQHSEEVQQEQKQ